MGGYHAGGAACRVILPAEILPAEILPADGEEKNAELVRLFSCRLVFLNLRPTPFGGSTVKLRMRSMVIRTLNEVGGSASIDPHSDDFLFPWSKVLDLLPGERSNGRVVGEPQVKTKQPPHFRRQPGAHIGRQDMLIVDHAFHPASLIKPDRRMPGVIAFVPP